MKKSYETPEVEVVKFQYRDQVVAASGDCRWTHINDSAPGEDGCENSEVVKVNNM